MSDAWKGRTTVAQYELLGEQYREAAEAENITTLRKVAKGIVTKRYDLSKDDLVHEILLAAAEDPFTHNIPKIIKKVKA
jgi:hypothetical protein